MSGTADTIELSASLAEPAIHSPAPFEADLRDRRQAALVAIGRRAIATTETAILVRDAAALIAETLEADHYGAAELDGTGRKLTLWLATTDVEERGRDPAVEHQADFNPRESLAAHAVHVAQVVSASDLSSGAPVLDRFLCERGIRGALVAPLQTIERSFGVLAAFSNRPRSFSPEDILFAETITHLVSSTIGRDHLQKALDDERRFTQTILATVDALVLVLDPDGRILNINSACERATGFSQAELAERTVWNTLVVHDEVSLVRSALERVSRSSGQVECETLMLTKFGERRRIRWNLAAIRNEEGTVESIVGTGIDVTVQRTAEERFAQHEGAERSADSAGSESSQGQLGRLPPGVQLERRSRPRRKFNFLQRVAPMASDKLPDRGQFHEVHCQDISSAGFSFVAANPPAHASYVVALGTSAVTIYLTANIVHVTAIIRDDATRYLVGCQYVDRANYPRKTAKSVT